MLLKSRLKSQALLYIKQNLDLTDNTQNYTYDNHNEVRNNNVASALSMLLEKKLVEYSDAQNRYIVTEGGRQLLTEQQLNVSKDELTS